MSALCEMVVSFRVAPGGDGPGDETPCGAPASWTAHGVPCCDDCRDAMIESGDGYEECFARLAPPAATLTVLHLKEMSGWNSGPDIRKCTECGVRLWIASDGTWTNDRKHWRAPPAGYICCADVDKVGAT